MPILDRELRRKYAREWVAKRRNSWFNNNGPCRRCWSYDNLELHHLDPKEKESHNIWSWSEERRNKELEKCIILCEHCHYLVHFYITRSLLSHGTENMYHAGCRCEPCKSAHTVFFRSYRAKRKEKDPTWRRIIWGCQGSTVG